MSKQDYSVLIIGAFCHPSHITRFIYNLKLSNPMARISLLTDRDPGVFPLEIHNCIDEYIKWRFTSRMRRIPLFNRLINRLSSFIQLRRLSKEKHYDIINIHYPQYFMCYLMGYVRRMATSIVVSPWGSDVLRLKGEKKRGRLAEVFRKADFITAGPNGEIGRILINEMKVGEEKLHFLAWGSETIDYINEHFSEMSTEDAKQKLGLSNHYVITCGYNAFEEQRHERMIEAIGNIKNQLPQDLVLLFPVTYGFSYGNRKKEYVEKLKELCRDYCLSAVFYEDYLSVAELFLLRQATDMFIHIQTTDGGNSSLQEYVLCGKKVVHGSWIHYSHLEQYEPLFYFPVDDLDHLEPAVLNAFHAEPINCPTEVLDYIRNRGWRAKMVLWNSFFVSIA